jgi:hypothetical protein
MPIDGSGVALGAALPRQNVAARVADRGMPAEGPVPTLSRGSRLIIAVVTTGAGAPRDSWFSPKIEVRASPVEGLGSFAVQRIEPGEVVEVWGERADGKLVVTYTADRGLAEGARAKGKEVGQWDDDLYSIEDRGADEGYFLNHSCDSNLWFKGAFTLVARRGAEPGEELTIDYALFEADEAFRAPWACRCGTEYCRGTVTGRDWQLADVQARYAGHFSPLLEKRIASQRSGLPGR